MRISLIDNQRRDLKFVKILDNYKCPIHIKKILLKTIPSLSLHVVTISRADKV